MLNLRGRGFKQESPSKMEWVAGSLNTQTLMVYFSAQRETGELRTSKCKAVVGTEAMSKGAQRTWKCGEESKCRADVASSSGMLSVQGKID